MHAMLLEKERVAVKMRHVVLKGDLVVLERFRKAGAAALGDIGKHFPDTDDAYKGISSIKLLEEVGVLLDKNNYIIENIDATIIAQKPKMRPYIDTMRENIAKALKIDVNCVNVKATTEEGLGFTGTGEGISSQAICSLVSVSNYIYGDSDMTNCCSGCNGCAARRTQEEVWAQDYN